MKIILDPGHGSGVNFNRGFININGFNYCNEGDCNYYYATQFLKPALEKEGIEVILTRNNINENPDLKTRGKMGAGCDLLISLHSNASGGNATGTEIWDSTNPNESIPDLCSKLTKNIAQAIGTNDRGVKYRKNASGSNWYGILRNGQAKHNMIIEHAFHDNYNDCLKYVNSLQKIANATAETIANYFNIKDETKESKLTFEQNKFIGEILSYIEKTDKRILPSVSLAQAILESNWGKSTLAINGNNLFGIKAMSDWNGQVYTKQTKEQKSDGTAYTINADFRKYNSWKESVQDHDNFFVSTEWRKKYYSHVLSATNYKDQCKSLFGTYATDRNYHEKLINIIEKYKLYNFDEVKEVKEVENKNIPSEWAEKYWEKAKNLKITDGTRPKEIITREETVVMILRALKLIKEDL